MREAYDGMEGMSGGGFVNFRDDASTRSAGYSTQLGGGAGYSTAAMLAPEGPDDDDASHYSRDDDAQQHGARSSYVYPGIRPHSGPYIPEYSLPSPPVPAFDRQDAMQSREYLHSSPSDPHRDLGRSRSIRSDRSYVDEQLRDLYVGHY